MNWPEAIVMCVAIIAYVFFMWFYLKDDEK